MQEHDTTKVGKYINEEEGFLVDPRLNGLLNNILDKIRLNPDKTERKNILKKLRLTRLVVFEKSAPIIDYILGSDNYREKIIELSEKLDSYVKKDVIDFSTVIDFSNDLSSKMKFHSILIVRNIKDELSEEELKELVDGIVSDNKEIVDKLLFNYRTWIKNIEDNKKLYEYFKEYEKEASQLALELLRSTINRIGEEKTRADRIHAMDVDREIKLYNQKHKSIHRVYNNVFE